MLGEERLGEEMLGEDMCGEHILVEDIELGEDNLFGEDNLIIKDNMFGQSNVGQNMFGDINHVDNYVPNVVTVQNSPVTCEKDSSFSALKLYFSCAKLARIVK